MSIIGIDLLQHHSLLIGLREQRLLDGNTNLSVRLTSSSGCGLSPVTVRRTTDPFYRQLLDKCSKIYQTQPKLPCVPSAVTHHIITTEPSVLSKARLLAPGKLRLAKNEFDNMMGLEVVQPPNRPSSSPLRVGDG
ncbi:unnamed protein product [Schistosoma mattheei]|uniref:Uncharacterized protein n=1 Tax=Schistosoma mattheei TaxID=31246 RepID=A0A183Q1J5_9TREM|nr:unnamed protein product [Schistosoma mattheei]